eukprot:NODE_7204_length_783_cov_139.375758_g6964_i0.p1 GENE.NODE_7204_length_783_cov_139.375758_g6964_i0~~NODE_7204_length_783_cov_139.375758_g6964_i0.p1  ORF type:complete len:184 (-),score=35.70 NODE_7204_length_783_cov_139.375758_g6964_i0:158-709(-)
MSNQLLMHAVSQGDAELAQAMVLEGCADVNCINSLGETPCHYAALRGSVGILELLLGFGADPNVNMKKSYGGATPILIATKLNHVQVVETLLQHQGDPNLPDSQGFTPLHIAAREGMLDISKLLICHGCNVEVPDSMGKTPYFWAKENNHTEIMKLLPQVKYEWSNSLRKLKDNIVYLDRTDK